MDARLNCLALLRVCRHTSQLDWRRGAPTCLFFAPAGTHAQPAIREPSKAQVTSQPRLAGVPPDLP